MPQNTLSFVARSHPRTRNPAVLIVVLFMNYFSIAYVSQSAQTALYFPAVSPQKSLLVYREKVPNLLPKFCNKPAGVPASFILACFICFQAARVWWTH